MKTIHILFISLICTSVQAQQWFDNSCKDIEEPINAEIVNSTKPRNILMVTINQAGVIELNDEAKPNISEIGFKEWVLNYITNPENDKEKAEKPNKIYIKLQSLNNDTESLNNLKTYIQDVYLYLWDKKAEEKYKTTYVDLKCKKRAKIFDEYPLRILATSKEKSKKNKQRQIGVPKFGGDVIDN